MAASLFSALWAMGRKAAAFLQSLFLSPFNTLLQALDALPSSARQTAPPTLPYSTADSSADPPPPDSSRDIRSTHGGDDSGMKAAPSPSAAAAEPQSKKPAASKMAPVPPPRGPPPPAKENRSPPNAAPPATDTQLNDAFSSLQFKGVEESAATLLRTRPQDATTSGTGSVSVAGHGADDKQPIALQQNGLGGGGETVQVPAGNETAEQAAEKAMHSRFMREALDMARLALKTNETPVGCVLVYKGRVIARGMNATNVTRNGTRHAELMAISALLSYAPSSNLEPAKASRAHRVSTRAPLSDKTNEAQPDEETSNWGDVDPRDGHLYPYGQKLHPSPRVDRSVITECTLYVTVEPCVMCASLLRQLGIKKVYFGAVNDKFGGTGGVFRIHKNSPYSMASTPPSPVSQNGKGIARPPLERRPASSEVLVEEQNTVPRDGAGDEYNVAISHIEPSDLPGDGGNVELGYEAEGGWGRDEAVTLLRQFYVQENNRAPVPRKKEGRAARLAAIMERNGHAGGPTLDPNAVPKCEGNSGTSTPNTQESTMQESAVQQSTEVFVA